MSRHISPPRPGGFWIRAIAHLIDAVLVFAFMMLIYSVGWSALFDYDVMNIISETGESTTRHNWALTTIGNLALVVLAWLYEAALTCSRYQATFGKMLLGLKVTDNKFERVGFGQASARHFAKYLSCLILGIGFLMAAFREWKEGLHDLVAKTYVVHRRPR